MNKKIIAIAITSVLATPVAMADVTISGALAAALANDDVKETGGGRDDSQRHLTENGTSHFAFNVTQGNAYAKAGIGLGGAFFTGAHTAAGGRFSSREAYLGLKGDWGSIQFGRMAGSIKGLESDPYVATLAQLRKTSAVSGPAGGFGSSGYINNIVEYKNKIGGMTLNLQMAVNDKGGTSADGKVFQEVTGEGYLGASLKGKAGGVNWWAGYNTYDTFLADTATDPDSVNSVSNTNLKVGASMKFGSVKATAQIEDNDTGSSTLINEFSGGSVTRTLLMADMGLGNGASINVAYANSSDVDGQVGKGTYMRLVYGKMLNKGTRLYVVYEVEDVDDRTTANATHTPIELGTGFEKTTLGVGLRILF